MTWRLLKVETKKITCKFASEWAEMQPAPHDRALSERRLVVYEKFVRAGNWRPCTWAKAICLETNETYRVNGKHTSTLFSTLASEYPDLTVVVETYECDTLEDIGRLYGTFDSAIAQRTTSDINRAFAATMPELADMPRKIIDSCVTGMAMHLAGGVRITGQKTPCERAENILEYPEFILWVRNIISDSSDSMRHLMRGGVTAAMFGAWLKTKKAAEEFWIAVRDETGATPTKPDRQLARWLLMTSVRPESEGKRLSRRTADIREMYVRCLYCWNAWRRGEDVKLIKYNPTAKVPAII